MRNDIKIKRIIKKYGLEGYGLYNLIVESIAESLSSDKPMPELEETARDIAEQYNNDTPHIEEIIKYMIDNGLFEISDMNGRLLCKKIYKFIDKSQNTRLTIPKIIDKINVLNADFIA